VRVLAVVRFGHRPPARPLSQTHRQDRLQYTAPQIASAQCNNDASFLFYFTFHPTRNGGLRSPSGEVKRNQRR